MTVRDQTKLLVCYQKPRFDRAAMARILGHIRTLLAGMTGDREQLLGSLEYLTGGERHQLLEWSRKPERLERGPALPIHRLFEAVAEKTPAAPAAIFATAREEAVLTYGALNGKANTFAHQLRAAGIGIEDRVAICMEPSLARLIGMLGVMKAGAAYVPMDPASPDSLLRDLVADCGASIVLVDSGGEQRFTGAAMPRAITPVDTYEEMENLSDSPAPDHLAYVIYTSGSTGKPKGVGVTHASLRHLVEAQFEALRMNSGSRVLQFASWSFDASVWEIFATLLAGARLYMAPRRLLVPSRDLVALMDRCAINLVTLPPSVLAAMPSSPLPSLTTLVSAGEACPAELVDRWAPGRRFLNAYGPTECTVCATIGEAVPHHGAPSIGQPFGESRIYVLDSNLRPTPIGVAGGLFIGGPSVARGYWNRPALTDAAFLPDPFSGVPGSRIYRTGDVARFLSNGEIEFLGRLDDQVKVRGIRVELGEIEGVLRQDPACREVAVVAIAKPASNEKSLAAYIVPQAGFVNGTGLDLSAVKERLRRRLPEHMVPSDFVVLDRFPLMPSGKLDRRALPKPQKGGGAGGATCAASPPCNDAERIIAEIWREILDLPEVGVRTNFFDHGGHSLLLLQVQDRIRERLGIEPAITDLFKYSTVESLALHLSRQREGSSSGDDQDSARLRARARQDAMAAKVGMKAQAKGAGKQMKETLKAALKEDLKSILKENVRPPGEA
jgi:amino acid adenylation domain-containing protein